MNRTDKHRKLTKYQARILYSSIKHKVLTYKLASRIFNISEGTIAPIIKGKNYTEIHKGRLW